jgi:hypothetical protein
MTEHNPLFSQYERIANELQRDSVRAAAYRQRAIELIVRAQKVKDEGTKRGLVELAYACIEGARAGKTLH